MAAPRLGGRRAALTGNPPYTMPPPRVFHIVMSPFTARFWCCALKYVKALHRAGVESNHPTPRTARRRTKGAFAEGPEGGLPCAQPAHHYPTIAKRWDLCCRAWDGSVPRIRGV
jgi:hypothetical protein